MTIHPSSLSLHPSGVHPSSFIPHPLAKAPLAEILRSWQLDDFRPLQRDAICAHLQGRDSLVVMPTGSGKSLCYQAPALLDAGLTLVVSPLISLMKDQFDSLQRRDMPAAFINSSQDAHEQLEVEQAVRSGAIKILYASPERVVTPAFITLLSKSGLSAIVIDEAHCIAQWGHDFRPKYAQLGKLRTLFPRVPIHAFTATATLEVQREIHEALFLDDPAVLIGDFDRPNIHLAVVQRTELDDQLVAYARRRDGDAGIVYCMTRGETERIADKLDACGIAAFAYHAGLGDDVRRSVQDAFMRAEIDVVVATVAFGMGIDRPDVRFVIHACMPSSMETYHQELGRAGRDGYPAESVILYDDRDFARWLDLFESGDQADLGHLEAKEEHLSEMDSYCHSRLSPCCRHRRLVEYFTDTHDPPDGTQPDPCGNCDLCEAHETSKRQNIETSKQRT